MLADSFPFLTPLPGTSWSDPRWKSLPLTDTDQCRDFTGDCTARWRAFVFGRGLWPWEHPRLGLAATETCGRGLGLREGLTRVDTRRGVSADSATCRGVRLHVTESSLFLARDTISKGVLPHVSDLCWRMSQVINDSSRHHNHFIFF